MLVRGLQPLVWRSVSSKVCVIDREAITTHCPPITTECTTLTSKLLITPSISSTGRFDGGHLRRKPTLMGDKRCMTRSNQPVLFQERISLRPVGCPALSDSPGRVWVPFTVWRVYVPGIYVAITVARYSVRGRGLSGTLYSNTFLNKLV